MAERIERADFGEHRDFVAAQVDAPHQVVDRAKASAALVRASVHSCEQTLQKQPACGFGLAACGTVSIIDGSSQPHFGHRSEPVSPKLAELRRAKAGRSIAAIFWPTSARRPRTYRRPSRTAPSASTAQSQSDTCTSIGLKRTPRRCASLTSVAGMIEAHRLVVEQRRVERRRVMHLEIRARIDDQREARRVRFGKAVERERRDRQHDAIGGLAGDAVLAPCPRAAGLRSASCASRIA